MRRTALGLIGVVLLGVCGHTQTLATTFGWDDHSSYNQSTPPTWEVETPGGIVTCTLSVVVGTERRCTAQLSRTTEQKVRLRGVLATCDPDGSGSAAPISPCPGGWSAPLTVPAGTGPGSATVTYAQPVSTPPPVVVTDNFDRSDGPLGSPNWSITFGSWQVQSNRVVITTTNSDTFASWAGPSVTDNHYAQLAIVGLPTGSGAGIAVRVQGSGATTAAYFVQWGSTGSIQIARVRNGIAVDIVTPRPNIQFVANAILRVEVTGSNPVALAVKINGTHVIGSPFNDSAANRVSSGVVAGLSFFSTGTSPMGDNFEAGELR